MNFCHQATKVGLLNHVQTTTTILGRIAIGIERMIDKGTP
ncbi:hypothetical protein BMETH_615_0 [methanotrophic bacterial endosymbiont of Bathymodiolus sp.]|nr:hypothetical protein BMETH_615_0 [methanotrophic bacterial endosymbiont of Bathymodiolus sp.]